MEKITPKINLTHMENITHDNIPHLEKITNMINILHAENIACIINITQMKKSHPW
jgi:hypothetical protein